MTTSWFLKDPIPTLAIYNPLWELILIMYDSCRKEHGPFRAFKPLLRDFQVGSTSPVSVYRCLEFNKILLNLVNLVPSLPSFLQCCDVKFLQSLFVWQLGQCWDKFCGPPLHLL